MATAAEIFYPQGVCATTEGDFYFAERVRKGFANGTIITIAGTGTAGSSGDGGLATSARLSAPTGVYYSNGEVFIADRNNNRIRKVSPDGFISTVVGGPSLGDNGLATNAQLSAPQDVLVTG